MSVQHGCNEIRWRPEQETSLAPLCSSLRFFGSKCTVLKTVLVTLLGLFGALAVIRRPGNCALLAPRRYALVFSHVTSVFQKWKCCDFECVKTDRYQYSVIFACFLCCVRGVSNSPVATPAYGLVGHSPSLRLRFALENASLLALYICATTQGPVPLL